MGRWSAGLARILPRHAYYFLRAVVGQREQLEAYPPTPPALQAEHLAGAQLLANREELLKVLPKGGQVAELGVDQGDFSAKILSLSKTQKLFLVDSWASARYGEDKRQSVALRFEQELAEGQVQIINLDSLSAAAQFASASLDWVYIDTDHGYACTIAELRAYADKVKVDGYLAGHDYTVGNWRSRFRYGVMEAVHEFCIEEGWKIAYLTMEIPDYRSFALKRLN